VKGKTLSIIQSCGAFGINQTRCRHVPKLSGENKFMTNWQIRLTVNQRNWNFGFCFPSLQIVKGYG